ncbi:hypothetical protein ACTHGU_02925 [Chitinophagaceae bacterium MMS25-I14]
MSTTIYNRNGKSGVLKVCEMPLPVCHADNGQRSTSYNNEKLSGIKIPIGKMKHKTANFIKEIMHLTRESRGAGFNSYR